MHQLYAIYHLIINQSKLKYTMRNVLLAMLTCMACRKTSSLKQGKSEAERREYLLRQGEHKLQRDLDIVSLIDMIKVVRVMRQVLFDQN